MLARLFALDTLGPIAFGEQYGIIHGDGGHFISDCIDGVPIAQAPRILLPTLLAKAIVALPIAAIQHAVQAENRIIEVRLLHRLCHVQCRPRAGTLLRCESRPAHATQYAGQRLDKTREESKGISIDQLPRETACQRIVNTPLSTTGQPIP